MLHSRPDRKSLNEVLTLVNQLTVDERKQLGRWMDFKSWDDAWDALKQELTETRAAKGLPPPSDEDIHDEIDARRPPEQLEALRREVRLGLESAKRGCIDADVVFAELTERMERRKTEEPRTSQVFRFVKTLLPEDQKKLRCQLGECW